MVHVLIYTWWQNKNLMVHGAMQLLFSCALLIMLHPFLSPGSGVSDANGARPIPSTASTPSSPDPGASISSDTKSLLADLYMGEDNKISRKIWEYFVFIP